MTKIPDDHQRPLAGLRLLALEQMQAAPYATQLLGWLGAEVIKVEPLGGEGGRTSTPTLRDVDGQEVGATYLRSNLAKQSVCIDLQQAEGVSLVLALAGRADVLVENYRPGVLDRLGLGFDLLHERLPSLVYASVSGFGGDGASPYRDWPAYAPVVEAMAGFYELRRQGDEPPPVGLGAAFGDICAALFAAVGILSAVRHRDRTGVGQHVDVAMLDAMLAVGDMISFMPSMGVPHPHQRSRGVVGAFRAADGFFVLTVVRERQFERLAAVLGHPEWCTEPRFARREQWVEQTEGVVRPAVEAWARTRTRREACAELAALGIPAGPSNTAADLRTDPHVAGHHMLLALDRPDSDQPLQVSGQPIRLSHSPAEAYGRWPLLGEHTDEVLARLLSLDQEAISSLRARRVIR